MDSTRDLRGVFVVLEGIDRCGKTLQAELLKDRLIAQGHDVQLFSTPDYEGFGGQEIASHLLGRRDLSVLGFEGLQLANRYVVASRVREVVTKGRMAICVRWIPSALLYGAIAGLDTEMIQRASSHLLEADLNILLDVNPMDIASRFDQRNIYERDLLVQIRLRQGYLDIWENHGDSDKWVVVDGYRDPMEVARKITQLPKWARLFGPPPS